MGLNDPQWGKNKGDSGPPDLDDVLRNVNKKINNIFGQKKAVEAMTALALTLQALSRKVAVASQ